MKAAAEATGTEKTGGRKTARPKDSAATTPRAPARKRAAVTKTAPPLAEVTLAPAAPLATTTSRAKSRPDDDATVRLVLARLDDMKAEDTTTIDLRDKSSIADTMVVTTGRSNRHVASIADRVIEDLGKAGVRVRVEGMPHCDWVLIDAGDVIVHVFRPEVRGFYNLEKMWAGGDPVRDAGAARAS